MKYGSVGVENFNLKITFFSKINSKLWTRHCEVMNAFLATFMKVTNQHSLSQVLSGRYVERLNSIHKLHRCASSAVRSFIGVNQSMY